MRSIFLYDPLLLYSAADRYIYDRTFWFYLWIIVQPLALERDPNGKTKMDAVRISDAFHWYECETCCYVPVPGIGALVLFLFFDTLQKLC